MDLLILISNSSGSVDRYKQYYIFLFFICNLCASSGCHVTNNHFKSQQGSICEPRKGPNRPPIRRGIDYLVYAHVLENQSFGKFLPTTGGRNCQKAHLHTKIIHLSLFPGLYNHPLQTNSLEKLMFRKTAVFRHFGQIRPSPMAKSSTSTDHDLSYEPIPRSPRPSVTNIQPVN